VTTNDELENDPATLETAMGDTVELHQLRSSGNDLAAGNETIDLVISNNDFSTGVDPLLEETPVPITPPPSMGWWNRKKIDHFNHQQTIMEDVAERLSLDPWHFIPATQSIDDVDFGDKKGFEEIAQAIDEIIDATEAKYDEHGIDESASAFVKSNQGTYGMGVYRFESGQDFLDINRDRRDSMARRKGGGENNSVIVQEGIRTVDRLESMSGELVAEPVIYCLEHQPLGGFLRTNEEQSDRDNLNSRGMNFSSEDLCTLFVDDADKNEGSNITQNKIEIYKLMGILGSLACGRELADLNAEATAT
jgi:glutamate--cysteine ligase